MRIHLKFSPTKRIVPYQHYEKLVSYLHQALQDDALHDNISLYSISWLRNGKGTEEGLQFKQGATWFVSAHDSEIIKRVLRYVQINPDWEYGLRVQDALLQETPDFTEKHLFQVANPVLVKQHIDKQTIKHLLWHEKESEEAMTRVLQKKLQKANLPTDGVKVYFDAHYHAPKTRLIRYKNVDNKANFCPVWVEGLPEQVAFAWNVGIGNNTGLGFGSLL